LAISSLASSISDLIPCVNQKFPSKNGVGQARANISDTFGFVLQDREMASFFNLLDRIFLTDKSKVYAMAFEASQIKDTDPPVCLRPDEKLSAPATMLRFSFSA